MKKFILIDLKNIDPENLETQNVKTIILTQAELDIHQRIGSELLNDKHIEEYIEDEQPKTKDKVVKIENEQLIPIEDPEKPNKPEPFEPNDETNDFDPILDNNVHEDVQETPLNSFVDKPKKAKKERIKASK